MDTADRPERDPRTHGIIGAAMEVHRVLGPGFLERVYHEALAREFTLRQIPFLSEHALPIHYKGMPLQTVYRADFFCFGEVIVEIKALPKLSSLEDAQLLHYLKATGALVGLLLNFGEASLRFQRFAN